MRIGTADDGISVTPCLILIIANRLISVLLIIILAAQHLECVENFVLDKPIVEYVGIVKCVSGYPCRVDENLYNLPDLILQ